MSIKSALTAGEVVIGGWLQIAHPTAAEAMRGAGLDFLTVDTEHGDGDLSAMTNTMRGMGETPAFVRVRENDTLAIRQALDCGAQGVFVPLVETAEEARRVMLEACNRHRKAAGFHLVMPSREAVTELLREGFSLLALGMDTVFIAEGAKKAVGVVREIEEA